MANIKENKGLEKGNKARLAFLLAQTGAWAAGKFADSIKVLGITPGHAGIIRLIALSPGLSQGGLCKILSILPSRLVIVMDELEKKELVERRNNPDDRRRHSLYLTARGQKLMGEIGKIAQAHGEEVSYALTETECVTLIDLLARIADRPKLVPGVHPGYKTSGRK